MSVQMETLEERINWSIKEAGSTLFEPDPGPFDPTSIEVEIMKTQEHGRRKIHTSRIRLQPLGKKGKSTYTIRFEEMDGVLRIVGDFC
jgi:hypothetical protein